MNKYIFMIFTFFFFLFIVGCQKTNIIQLTADQIELELGQNIDMSKYYKEENKKDLQSHITIDDSKVQYEEKDNVKYPKIGQYTLTLQYKNDKQTEEKEVSLTVKDTVAPTIQLKKKIEIVEGTEIKNWDSYFDIEDHDQTTLKVNKAEKVEDDYYKKEGTYDFQAVVSDSSQNQTTLDFTVTVLKPVLSFVKKEITLYESESQTLKTTQENLTQKIVYKSNHTNIVTINQNGKIKALSPGTATMTVSSGDLKDECQITVKEKKQVVTTQQTPQVAQTSETTKWTLNVPYYNQYAVGSPMGCEGASLLEALNYKGYANAYRGNLTAFLNAIPKTDDGNPYHGYVGDPFVNEDASVYQSIFPSALAPWAAQFGNVVNISGCGLKGLQDEIKNGNPVVVYVTYQFRNPQWADWPFGRCVNNMHVMTLCGYDATHKRYLVADPAPSTKACGASTGIYWVSESKFANSYNALNWAIAVR